MLRVGPQNAKPTEEECLRAAGRAFLQIAIRLELERRAAAAVSSETRPGASGVDSAPLPA